MKLGIHGKKVAKTGKRDSAPPAPVAKLTRRWECIHDSIHSQLKPRSGGERAIFVSSPSVAIVLTVLSLQRNESFVSSCDGTVPSFHMTDFLFVADS
ncbi:hypothetical protein BaRGS_00008565 [Batillaria attramentaria]|uniref:Uncharacterized protein n=1 Tax=Batillaria attramentaria TaxID=370345 RepID=A0ABD0LKR3_9CAEN